MPGGLRRHLVSKHHLVGLAPLVLLPAGLPSPQVLELAAAGHGAVGLRAALGVQVEQAPYLQRKREGRGGGVGKFRGEEGRGRGEGERKGERIL